MLNGKKFKIFAAQKIDFAKVGEQPGDFETDNKSHLHIQTGGNAIAITQLQMEGKKRMDIKSFFNRE